MCITTHFIDTTWTLKNFVVGFPMIPSPHSGENISRVLLDCLEEYNILSRSLCIVMDNASNNSTAITCFNAKYVEKGLTPSPGKANNIYGRCCAHIFNLIANAGFEELGNLIKNLR